MLLLLLLLLLPPAHSPDCMPCSLVEGNGAEEMFLDVAADNTVAQRFYHSLGFISCPFTGPSTTEDIKNSRDGSVRLPLAANQANTASAQVIMYRAGEAHSKVETKVETDKIR